MGHKRVFFFFAPFFLSVFATAFWGVETLPTNQPQNTNKNHYPIAEYGAPEPIDNNKRALRKARGGRYSRGRAQLIKELPTSLEELPVSSHWWWTLSALPVSQSDAVLLGEIIEAQAFLSEDKTAVYSEFTVGIYEVLKGNKPLAAGDRIVAERAGGGVRFKSGRVQYYTVDKQGLPRVGSRYVLFLRRNDVGDDFSVLTAYELRSGRVFPLDAAGDNRNDKLPFDEYRGYEENNFLSKVRDIVARSLPPLHED